MKPQAPSENIIEHLLISLCSVQWSSRPCLGVTIWDHRQKRCNSAYDPKSHSNHSTTCCACLGAIILQWHPKGDAILTQLLCGGQSWKAARLRKSHEAWSLSPKKEQEHHFRWQTHIGQSIQVNRLHFVSRRITWKWHVKMGLRLHSNLVFGISSRITARHLKSQN